MATSAGELIYTVDVDTARMITDTKRAEKQMVSLENKMNSTAAASGKLSTAMTKVGVAVAAAISVQQLSALQKLSEGFNLLRSRVTRLSEDAATAAQNFDNLVAIANKTGSSVADTVKLWEGLTATLKEFGATSGDVQTLVETLQKIGVVGGSSAEEMSNALRQLGQAISGGTLRAEEFNSIIEQMPELGRQIAAGLGIPFSELRAQMLAGELTSKKVLDAIYSQVDTVNKEFAKMPRTVAQASNALVNSFGDAISLVDKEIGASQNIAKFLDILAKGVEATFSKQLQDRQRFNDLLVERQNLQESINQVERNSPTSTKQLDLMRQRLASINKELRDMQDAEKKRTIESSKGQEKKDRPDYTKNIKEAAKADKEAESASKKAAKARDQNSDAIADAKLKTEQLRLELANLKAGTDEASGATSRYSIESARLAAQQQLNKEATKEQVEALAQQILAQKQITDQIAQQGRLEAQKKEAQGFVKQQAFDAASPLEQIDIEEQAKIAKLEEYRNLELISLQEFEATKNNIIKQAADERAAIELARNSMILSASSDFFGGMADLTGAFAGEQSGAYKALFAISKGFAIANAALQLQTAIANASALPWPANFPAIAQAVALGGQIASNIAGVNYGGAREFGGPVDAGKMYRVGEGGKPEVFQSGGKNFMIPGDGGKVIPNDQIGGGGFSQSVQVHNYSGENVQTKTSMDGKQLEVVIGEVAKQISQRRGGVGRALASSTATKWKAQ
jgi:tape measure domain-containing protein